ncbi:aminoglycoside phosphotransferase [Paenibacillus albidus]|uniref:Aminoglycoside phosphotransferase n=1 Tax=Paenibacillus albidus TaxID=2041023 RepID=A0A917FLQ9_9BACL|nr:phosphotransferase [Paenibacillus albidus]GGF90271.1 aminoglycoside phosphotransferase [Paenibacillus albidus]
MDTITGIPGSEAWTVIQPILKGWSSDRKYFIEDKEGQKRLLRLSDRETYDRKREEYEMIQRVNPLDFPMSRAVDFGITTQGENIYMLLTWVEGRPLEECLLSFTEQEQYRLGTEAGGILKRIHSIPNYEDLSGWEDRMKQKILDKIKEYEHCPYRIPGDEAALAYVRGNIGLIVDTHKVYQHRDFHIGNLIYTSEGRIGVIDFNRSGSGDYVEEFYKLQSFDRERSLAFAQGKLDGYFGGPPPESFWKRLAVYVAFASLSSIQWAIPYGQEDIEGMQARCELALADYEQFTRVIPGWYRPFWRKD